MSFDDLFSKNRNISKLTVTIRTKLETVIYQCITNVFTKYRERVKDQTEENQKSYFNKKFQEIIEDFF